MTRPPLPAWLFTAAVIFSFVAVGRADSIGISYSTVGAFDCNGLANCTSSGTGVTINTSDGSVSISFTGASIAGKAVPFDPLTTTSSLGLFDVTGTLNSNTTNIFSTGVLFTMTTTQSIPTTGSSALGSTNISGNISLCTSCSVGGDVYITFDNPGTAVSGNAVTGTGAGNFQIAPVDYQVVFDQGGTTPANSLDLAVNEASQTEKFQLSATPAPEPGSMLLLGSGVLSFAGFRRRWFK